MANKKPKRTKKKAKPGATPVPKKFVKGSLGAMVARVISGALTREKVPGNLAEKLRSVRGDRRRVKKESR